MTWLDRTATGDTPLERVLGLRPDASDRFRELYAGLWSSGCDPVVLELCRLRVATVLGCEGELLVRYRVAVDAGLTDALVDALPRWHDDPRFDGAARAAIAFTEQYVIDPHGLTDRHFDELHAHVDEPTLATIALAVAMFDALTRMRLALDVAPVAEGVTVVDGPAATVALP